MDKVGSGDGFSLSLSLKRLRGGDLGGGPLSLDTVEDMLRKSPDMGSSLHRGPFSTEGYLVCVRVRIPGTLIDE
jgi:hypothetical protein